MNLLKSAKQILSPNTIVVAILSILSTYLCILFQVYADFPLTLIGIAVVFPIVFSIGTAYTRREKALADYGTLKAHGRSIYFATRDWVPNSEKRDLDKLKKILWELLHNLRELFLMKKEQSYKKEKIIYSKFSEISLFLKDCGERGMTPGGF